MPAEHIYANDVIMAYAVEMLELPDITAGQLAFISALYDKTCRRIAKDAGIDFSLVTVPSLRIVATNQQTEADLNETNRFINLTYGCKDCGGVASNPTQEAFDSRRCNKCQKERDEDMAYRMRQEHPERAERSHQHEHSTHHPRDGKA